MKNKTNKNNAACINGKTLWLIIFITLFFEGVKAQTDTVYVSDRFGNYFPLESIRIPPAGSSSAAPNECIAGIFHLYFTDPIQITGFNDANGTPYRDAACRVFTDLSQLLTPANNPFTGLPNTSDLVSVNLHAYLGGNPLVAGQGSSIYNEYYSGVLWNNSTNNGIVDGEVWKTINGGYDSYIAFGNYYIKYYHGDVVINFAPGFTWNLDYTIPDPATDVDLYTVMLHEAIHMLGFSSLLSATGTSTMGGTNFYTRYDTHLNINNGTLTPILNNPNSCGNVLYSGVNFITGCNTRFIGTNNEPAIAGNPYLQGQSFMHFDENCPPNIPYVMANGGVPGTTRRHPTQNDVTALCDIGYHTTTTYGVSGTGYDNYSNTYTACGIRIAGVDDIFHFNTFNEYTYTDGQPPILMSDFLQNDEDESSGSGNPVTYDCLTLIQGTGTITTPTATSFKYQTPAGFNGWSILRYIPVGNNGKRGNLTYIYILSIPPSNCSANCNFVEFGDLEAINNPFCQPLSNFTISGGANSPDLYGWNNPNWVIYPPNGTGTQYPNFCSGGNFTVPPSWSGTSNTRYIGMAGSNTNVEGLTFHFCNSLQPGSNCVLDFYGMIVDNTCSDDLEFHTSEVAPCLPGLFFTDFSSPNQCTSTSSPFSYTQIASQPINSVLPAWQHYTIPFTYNPANGTDIANYLTVSPKSQPYPDVPYIFVDDISLSCKPSTSANITNATSGCNGAIDLTVTGCSGSYTFFWSNNATTEDITNLCAGTYTVTVTDASGCTATDSYTITGGSPLCTATTMIPTNSTSTTYGSAVFTGPATVDITGTFYVNTNLIISSGCTVYMEEGAEIIVTFPGTLTIDNSVLRHCVRMWRGITLLSGTGITMTNNAYIIAANVGIYCNDRTKFNIKDSHFVEDITGIYTVPNASGAINNITGTTVHTEFVHIGPIPPPYFNQPPYGGTPYAGMDLNNMKMTIGDNTAGLNLFGELNFGILMHQSQITVTNTSINEAHKDLAYGNNFYDGSAICAFGGPDKYFINVYPLAPGSFFNTINQSDIGVYANYIDAGVYGVDIIDVKTGVHATVCHNAKTVNVDNCEIVAYQWGIKFRYNSGSAGMNATNNRITIDAVLSNYNGIGISARDGNPSADSKYNIFNNYIELVDSKKGIDVWNTSKPSITWNIIHQTNFVSPTPRFIGIDIYSLPAATIKCNTVYGSGASNFNSWGLRSNLSSTTIHCNHVNDLHRGIEFDGPPTIGTDFKDNTMNNHFYGLYLNSNAFIGFQFQCGNIWNGTYLSTFGATNLNSATAFDVSQNEFDVHTTLGYPYFPPNQLNAGCMGCQWFVQTAGSPYDCDTHTPAECLPFDADRDGEKRITSLDRTIAQGNLTSAEWQDESRAMTKQYLYEKLHDNDSLVNADTSMANFFNGLAGSVNEKIKSVKDQSAEMFVYDANFALVKQYNDSLIDTLRNVISYNEGLIAAGDSDTTLTAQNVLLYQQLNDAMATLKSLFFQRDSLKQVQADAAKAVNTQIITPEIVAANEKIVNDIYLRTIAVDNYTFTPQQEADLYSIATECPYAGGVAVYEARDMYSLINDTIDYDDSTACALQGIFRMQSASQHQSSKSDIPVAAAIIKPNPAAESATIDYTISSESSSCSFIITDVAGKQLLSYSLPCDKKEFSFSTASLANGMYLFKIISNGIVINKGKLAISK